MRTALAQVDSSPLRRLRGRIGERLGIASRERLARLEAELAAETEVRSGELGRAWELLDGHEVRVGRLERQVRIATVMAWIADATLTAEPLISIVLPTRDRAEVLGRAIDSVRDQSYSNWELLICEDGPSEPTADLLAGYEDPRIVHLPAPHAGASVARNRGLDAARGELVAYLDDDNRMHRGWLKSIAWAFEQRPEVEVLYGAIVIDDTSRHHHGDPGEMPSAWHERFDREALARTNLADTSAIAHRAGLPEARWRDSLKTLSDWELMRRLSEGREPLALPAIACYYHSDTDARLSTLAAQIERDRATVLGRRRAPEGRED